MYYAGIGSRNTPDHIKSLMVNIAATLEDQGYILRSGGANGADRAFERGVSRGNKEIYLPFEGFNSSDSNLFNITTNALLTVDMYHTNPRGLSDIGKKLMARNAYQVLGQDLHSPVDFVVCWTPDGCNHFTKRSKYTGGTGQAIEIASRKGISVYNLKNDYDLETFMMILDRLKEKRSYIRKLF